MLQRRVWQKTCFHRELEIGQKEKSNWGRCVAKKRLEPFGLNRFSWWIMPCFIED
jgi:hypothetical protein